MDQKKIGAFIAEMRKARQLTQHDLADIIGISDKTVSRWETGRGMPEVSLIIPLCNVLGITATELLSGNRPSDNHTFQDYCEWILSFRKWQFLRISPLSIQWENPAVKDG